MITSILCYIGVSSEHYHMINYGIGGQIDVHVDYWGPNRHPHPGGARMATFLGYMSDVEAGGRTIFPQLALSNPPIKGDALFWLTTRNDQQFDSQMYHAGCPVLYGNKWAFTKWIYSDDQMWTHPCQIMTTSKQEAGSNFPKFSNDQMHGKIFSI